MSASSPVDTYRVDLPTVWREVPTDAGELRKMVQSSVGDGSFGDLSTVERRRVELFFERLIRDIADSGASFVAVYADAAEADDGEREDALTLASLTVSTLTRQQLGTTVPLTASIIVAAMSDDPAGDDRSSGASSVTLEPASVVSLPVGDVARLVRLLEIGRAPNTTKIFIETFFVPVADAYDHLLVLQFATPNVEDARAFSELFGAIAGTTRFYREGEPTEP